jgi:formylglycine-generating enzyme required for sulfatase activity
MLVKYGFWMGRTEVTVRQLRRLSEGTGYVSDAEKPGERTQCFKPKWTHYNLTTQITHPWEPMPGKGWRDPSFQFPLRDDFPVVCVSWTDARACGKWLAKHKRAACRLPEARASPPAFPHNDAFRDALFLSIHNARASPKPRLHNG